MRKDDVDELIDRIAREWPELDYQIDAIVTRIVKTARYLERELAGTARALGINTGEYFILAQLRGAGTPFRLSPGELSASLLVSTGAMTNRLDRLEGGGLIRRLPDPSDRRGVLIELTSDGDRIVQEAARRQGAREVELFSGLTQRDKTSLNATLRKLLLHFEVLLGGRAS